MNEFTKNALEQIGYYVYLYLDPDTNEIFYVGKGKDNRAFSHLFDQTEHEKVKKIEEIKSRGKEPKIEILAYGLETEDIAFKLESAAIDLLGIQNLTNKVKGHHSFSSGRMTVGQINDLYQDERADITEPSLLIRINKLFRYDMTPHELYEATRGIWVLDKRRCQKATYAFAVYNGIVQEVYEISSWHKAGSTPYTTRVIDPINRLEFLGVLAPDNIRETYKGKVVSHYMKKGDQNSVRYINC